MGRSDLDIARAARLEAMEVIAGRLGLAAADIEPYGRHKAKAGFVVAYAGDILTMPGLPKVPAAEAIDIDAGGNVVGLF